MHNITVINAKNGHTLKWVTQHNTVLYCYAIIRLFALAVYNIIATCTVYRPSPYLIPLAVQVAVDDDDHHKCKCW